MHDLLRDKIPYNKKMINKIIIAVLILSGGISIGYYLHDEKIKNQPSIKVVRESSSDYKFIDPLLFLEVPESDTFPAYKNFKNIINTYVTKVLEDKKASDVSVYFRDFNTSRWVGINSEEKLSPASMMKVVTLISVLSAAESNPDLLTKGVNIASLPAETTKNQDLYPPKDPVQEGKTYTVQELLTHLIVQSDNNANIVLENIIGENQIKKVYDDLQIPPPTGNDYMITSQQYSHLFRVLYGATYLQHNLSEQVLKLLSQTTFTQGIVAGVPEGTQVSHKFGERSQEGSSVHELHDCGIVYYPKNPYFLCIMTKGSDFPTLTNVIKDISNIVWKNKSSLDN